MYFKTFLPGYTPGEEIKLFLRRSWFIFFWVIVTHLILALVPILIYYAIPGIFEFILLKPRLAPFLIVLGSIYYLSLWLFLFNRFLDHFLDVWIVTNKRIINIEQGGLFSRTVSEQKLDKIQDVTYEIQGFWATMFGYGTVYVQTAGEKERFIFKKIPKPARVSHTITELTKRL